MFCSTVVWPEFQFHGETLSERFRNTSSDDVSRLVRLDHRRCRSQSRANRHNEDGTRWVSEVFSEMCW